MTWLQRLLWRQYDCSFVNRIHGDVLGAQCALGILTHQPATCWDTQYTAERAEEGTESTPRQDPSAHAKDHTELKPSVYARSIFCFEHVYVCGVKAAVRTLVLTPTLMTHSTWKHVGGSGLTPA